jgi:hypothetical protein
LEITHQILLLRSRHLSHLIILRHSGYSFGIKDMTTVEQRQAERIVHLYMLALGKEKLSVETWKKLSRVNEIVLRNKKTNGNKGRQTKRTTV